MAAKLTPQERETVILFSDADETAEVYTHDRRLIKRLKLLASKHPEKVMLESESHESVRYTVPKRCVAIREPYSDERRKAVSERAKTAGYRPPVRSKKSD